MIVLRELQREDAEKMLEWMHDPEVAKGLKKNMQNADINDAISFCISSRIPSSLKDGDSIHFAIVDDKEDEYLGTVSLKDIDLKNETAEYAIVLRRTAQGRGVAFQATGLILKKAFHDLGLHRVFLSVYANNLSAIHLYERSGFRCEGSFREHFQIDGKRVDWKWYGILDSEYDERRFHVC